MRFTLPTAADVRIALTDVTGREVARPVDARLDAGPHEAEWTARDAAGRELKSGLYFAILSSGGERRVERLVIAR